MSKIKSFFIGGVVSKEEAGGVLAALYQAKAQELKLAPVEEEDRQLRGATDPVERLIQKRAKSIKREKRKTKPPVDTLGNGIPGSRKAGSQLEVALVFAKGRAPGTFRLSDLKEVFRQKKMRPDSSSVALAHLRRKGLVTSLGDGEWTLTAGANANGVH